MGAATITVKTVDGGKTATCKITVGDVPVTGVSLNESSKTLKVDEVFTLKATVTPEDASNKDVTWKSSAKDIATVDKDGRVTGKKKGDGYDYRQDGRRGKDGYMQGYSGRD